MKVPLAIIGNGAAAAEAVIALRAHGYTEGIDLFADNEQAPFNPMLGPYLAAGAIPLERVFPFGDGAGFYGGNRVNAHLGEAVVSLDAVDRTITTAKGSVYHYCRCLVASGARPSVPPIAGLREALAELAAGTDDAIKTLGRIFTMRTLDDALSLKKAAGALLAAAGSGASGSRATDSGPAENPGAATTDAPRAAIIGASLAGMKMAAVLRQMGMAVSLIEKEPHILPLSAHPECARLMEDHLVDQGYDLRLEAELTRVKASDKAVRLCFGPSGGPDASGNGPGGFAGDGSGTDSRGTDPRSTGDRGTDSLGTGDRGAGDGLDVDLVVVCTGSRPSLDFLVPGQVTIGTGILVDEQLRSNVPTLYAAGDAAEGMNLLTGRHEIIGLWASARYQGRAAGRSLAGAPGAYRGGIPHSITPVGKMLFASLGCLKEYDRMAMESQGDRFKVRVWQDGRLVGVNLLNCCLSAGALKQALLKAASGVVSDWEATWTSFSA